MSQKTRQQFKEAIQPVTGGLLLILEPQSYSGILHDGVGIMAIYEPAVQEWDAWIYDGKPIPDYVWVVEHWGIATGRYVVRSRSWAVRKMLDLAIFWQRGEV